MPLRLARDDRLARLAASGDSRAFAVIYERYHQPIYRYCHSILNDPDDAADALQNAMLKAMRGLEGSERDIALKPWLFRIAHNEAISLVRRRRPTTALEAVDEPSGPSTDQDAATRERLTQLVEDLRELPDRQRGALLMRELGGLGFQEIADIFDVSPAAAKQTVYEARTALHEYADGRDMRCEDARKSLSAGDRRMLRGRKLAAHLRDCSSCREFQELMRLRSRDVAALAPPISAGASAAVLQGIIGAGAGGGAGGGGLIAWLTGSGAKTLLGSEAAKSLLAAALVTASAGTIGVVSALQAPDGGAGTAGPVRQARDAAAAPDAMTLRNIDTSASTRSGPAPAERRSRRGGHGHANASPAPSGQRQTAATGVSNGGPAAQHGGSSGPASSTGPAVAAPVTPSAPQAPTLSQLTPPAIAENIPSLPATPTVEPQMLDFVAAPAALPDLP